MNNLRSLLPPDILSVTGSLDLPIEKVTYDSRQVVPGSLFVAMPGTTVDGSRFIPEALERGAVALITESTFPSRTETVIRVKDARRALSAVARQFYGDPSEKLQCIGITGTKGKTTTTYLIQAILQRRFGQAFRFGTVEYDLGPHRRPAKNTTPESLDLMAMLRETADLGVRAGVMEVSSHALKTWRVEDLTFAAAGFTNLSLEHTEFHPDMEDYFQAKRRLFFDLLPRGRTAVIGIDDEWGQRLAREAGQAGIPVLTISVEGRPADIGVSSMTLTGVESRFVITASDGQFPCRMALGGRFNVFNALMAAGLTRSLGLTWPEITSGIEGLTHVPGRFEAVANTRGLTVIVDYAHSPAALENLLQAIRPLAKGRMITVFGCGGNRSHEKRPIMGRLSATLSDVTVVTSDNPRKERPEDIIQEIMAGIEAIPDAERREVHVEADRRKAIGKALQLARPDDIILIAGKGHESGQTFADRTVPFDDREVARELLGETAHA